MSGDYSSLRKVQKLLSLFLFLALFTIQLSEAAGRSCGPESLCTFNWYCSNETINNYGIISYRSSDLRPCLINSQVCCNKKNINEPPKLPYTMRDCGLRYTEKPKPMANDIGPSSFQEFPWVVAIYLNSQEEYKFLGGGSIVAPNVVLTAAHIVFSQQPRELVVRAGEWDTQSENEPFKHRNVSVLGKIAHQLFNKDNGHYDIALLVLKEPLDLTQHISTICLPRSNESLNFRRCFVAGWGKNTSADGQFSNIMKKVNLPILDHTECQEKFRKTILGRYFELHESFMCAGGEKDNDACFGDGGSPLFCPLYDHPNQYFQMGIVAWGLGCQEINIPGAYADVYYMQTWIRDMLKELNISPSYYTPKYTNEYMQREQNAKSLVENK